MAPPLTGIRVVEYQAGIAAATAGLFLRDAGAEVIKLEPLGGRCVTPGARQPAVEPRQAKCGAGARRRPPRAAPLLSRCRHHWWWRPVHRRVAAPAPPDCLLRPALRRSPGNGRAARKRSPRGRSLRHHRWDGSLQAGPGLLHHPHAQLLSRAHDGHRRDCRPARAREVRDWPGCGGSMGHSRRLLFRIPGLRVGPHPHHAQCWWRRSRWPERWMARLPRLGWVDGRRLRQSCLLPAPLPRP